AVAERAETWIDRIVGQVYHTYQERLRLNNALDFDDLLTFPVHLFTESPETLERYRERWRYVMVDEFQDTNRVQYVLTRMLAQGHRNVCVVGDDDQSIYSWRGANIANMLDFEKDFPGARLIKLEQNYRSTQIILDVAHAVVVVNQGRKDKKLWTENGTGLPVSVQFMPSDVEEARFVVREIRRLEARGEARPQDCAVLYRTNAQSRLLERACVEDQLPYQVIGGPKFYERREIRDLLAYLRLIANPSDEASLKRIINTPPRGLGEKSLEELERFARAGGISLWQAIERVDDVPGLTARATTSIKAFHRLIAELAEAAGSVPLADLLGRIIEGSSYQQYINPDDSLEGQDRWENVGSLLTQAATFTPAEDQQALIQFLDEVALVSDQDALEDETPGATLITLHAAKGLEFPVVFIIGMSENIFPHRRVMEYPEQLEEER
ncbi:MAG: UvrD-helicase domain-containing protein, partial [Chloroflexota bacterium]|nr:UvrD-helicase domain-containing protein [Chloroflexota bacterium]